MNLIRKSRQVSLPKSTNPGHSVSSRLVKRGLKASFFAAQAIACAFGILPTNAEAVTVTWNGGTGGAGTSWNDPLNWVGGVPTTADTVGFISAGTGTTVSTAIGSGKVISLDVSQTINTLNIPAWGAAKAFTIGSAADILSGNTLTLTNVFRGDNNSNTQTIAANVILGGNSTWNIVNGYNGYVAVTGNISGDGMSLTKLGTNNLVFTGSNTYSGGTTISEGMLTLGDGTRNGSVVGGIVNNATLVFNNPFSQTVGNISGTGAVTKSGAGTLTLGGATSALSSGKFTITGGGLDTSISGLVLSNSSYAWNGDFTYVGSNSLDLGSSAVTLSAARTVTVSANTLAVGGAIGGAFSLTKSGSGTLQLSGTSTYSGGTTINGGTLSLVNTGKIVGNMSVNNAGTLTLDSTIANADRIANSATITLSGKLNLIGNASTATSETMGVLTEGGGGAVVTLAPGSGQSALLTFSSLAARTVGNGATGLYRGTGLGSALGADTSNIIFTTAPTVTALGAFAATDTVGTLGTVNAAVLRGIIFDNSATGTGLGFATYDATNGVRLLNATTEQTTTYASGNANIRLDLAGAVAITGAATNTLQLDNVSGGAQVVTNAGALLAPQNGLLFTGNNAITLNGGTLNANTNTSNKEALILSTNTAGVTIGTALTGENVTVGGTGDITLNGAVTAKTFTANAVRINNSGTTTLAAAETGAIVINNGTLKLATGGSLYSATQDTTSNATINLTVNGFGTLDLNGISATTNGFAGAGVITNNSGTLATLTANYQPGGGNFATFTPTFSGNITGNVKLFISGAGYYITNYTQILSGSNSFTGGVSLSGAGQTLRLLSPTALGTGTLTLASGAKIDSNNQTLTTNNPQTWNGAWTYTGGSGSLNMGAGAVNLAANSGVTVSANSLTVGGAIGEAGGARTFTKAGTGTLVLNGANTYTGATTVSAGTLRAGVVSVSNVSGAFGNNSAVTMANVAGATLDITGFNTQIGSLTGGGALGGNVSLGAATLTTGGDNTSPAAYAGVISGIGGSLTKIGTGSQTLSGANTYTGATTVSQGTLIVSGSISGSSNNAASVTVAGSIAGTGALNLASGNQLFVSGTLTAGDPSAGTKTGTFNVTETGASMTDAPGAGLGSLNFAAGATFSFKLGATTVGGSEIGANFGLNDKVNVTGRISLDGASLLSGSLLTGFTAAENDLFFVGLNDGTDGITGTFSGLAQGSLVTLTGPGVTQMFSISYTADSTGNTFTGGNDLALMAVPEPATWAMLLGGIGVLISFQRRRTRRRF